jgi:subtilisin family serine protease
VRVSRLALAVAAAALVLSGWTSASAVAPSRTTDTVRVAVVQDRNGSAPGGVQVTALQVDPDQVDPVTEHLEDQPGVLHAEVDTRVSIAQDPLAAQQYSTARVRADRVQDRATGDGVVVAVIDSGVLATHPDLATPLPDGRPRVLRGTSFLTPSSGQPDLTGAPGTVDPNGHGTHVAGIIAAARGNGIGIAGIAPAAQILPVRALDAEGYGWASDVAAAILWSHDAGADVINLSLAGPAESGTVSAAIDWVTLDGSRGTGPTIVVAAAGNSGTAYPRMWPAAHPRAIAVASTDRFDSMARFSSRGSYVDVAAPGVGILSACVPVGYCTSSGTSMASPLVAGAAALLREQDPLRDGPTVEAILESSAHDIGLPGQDTSSGHGRIDVAAALDPSAFPVVPRTAGLPTGRLDAVRADGRVISVQGRAADVNGPVLVRIESTLGSSRWPREVRARNGTFTLGWTAPPGTHEVCASVADVPTGQVVPLGCRDVLVK